MKKKKVTQKLPSFFMLFKNMSSLKNSKREQSLLLLPFAIKHNMNYSLKFVALIKNSLYYGYKKTTKNS